MGRRKLSHIIFCLGDKNHAHDDIVEFNTQVRWTSPGPQTLLIVDYSLTAPDQRPVGWTSTQDL